MVPLLKLTSLRVTFHRTQALYCLRLAGKEELNSSPLITIKCSIKIKLRWCGGLLAERNQEEQFLTWTKGAGVWNTTSLIMLSESRLRNSSKTRRKVLAREEIALFLSIKQLLHTNKCSNIKFSLYRKLPGEEKDTLLIKKRRLSKLLLFSN